jgi:hypothetical protein
MGIAIRPNQSRHLRPITRDLSDHVPEHAKAGNDLGMFGSQRMARDKAQTCAQQEIQSPHRCSPIGV